MRSPLTLYPLNDFPRVAPGDDLGGLLISALECADLAPVASDVLVIAQKVVSKAEGRYISLSDVTPGAKAIEVAQQADKDPRLVELILAESRALLRVRPGVVIVEHNNGYVHANAGIDSSNIPNDKDNPRVLLLPKDSDASAYRLREQLAQHFGTTLQVIINDSTGRAWRNGTVGIAIGCAGVSPLYNQVGEQDLYGNELKVTEAAVADELAAAASLVMGQAAEGCPVVLARGANLAASEAGSAALLRDKSQDLFR